MYKCFDADSERRTMLMTWYELVCVLTLQALDLPKEYYPVTDSLPVEAITQGKLSCLQLEGIIHAVSHR